MTLSKERSPASGSWDTYYRRYQERLALEYLIPVLGEWGVRAAGARLLEVGGGDGGCGAGFAKRGARVVMVELEARLAAIAEQANQAVGLDIAVHQGDVYDENAAFYAAGPFDIVLFRDVMEHLHDPVRALQLAASHLAPGGVLFVIFPPYFSPFGAHQQILPRKKLGPLPYNKLPYLQLLPKSMFFSIVDGDTEAHREVKRLRSVCLTLRKFHAAIEASGLQIRHRRLYLSRPSFALRYGIPVVRAGLLGTIPGLNELLTTGAYYLLGVPPNWTR